MNEAMRLADSEVDFSKYHFVMVLHAGEYEGSWAWAPELGSTDCKARLDGSCQDRVALIGEDFWRGVGFHEFGHLLSLPDIYDYELRKSGDSSRGDIYVDGWDLMGDSGGLVGLSAWSRMKLGWINSNQTKTILAGQKRNVTLAPVESANGTLAAEITLTSSKYYIVEYRQPIGYDQNVPGKGVLVYLAYDQVGSGQGPLRLVSKSPFSLVYDPSSDSNLGYIDESNNVAIVLGNQTGVSYQIVITTASVGHILIQRIHESLKSSYTAASESINQASDAITRAVTQGRYSGLDEANQLLSKARSAFSWGDYTSALSLAQHAKKVADAATEGFDQAANAVNQALGKLSILRNATLQSPDAIELGRKAEAEYAAATEALKNNQFGQAIVHAKNSTALTEEAFAVEHDFQVRKALLKRYQEQQQLLVLFGTAVVAAPLLITILVVKAKKTKKLAA